MKLPRDWLGPRSELVPFGPSADRAEAEAARAKSADDPVAKLVELVPPPDMTHDDFWGGALDAIPRPVIGPEPAERPRQRLRNAEPTLEPRSSESTRASPTTARSARAPASRPTDDEAAVVRSSVRAQPPPAPKVAGEYPEPAEQPIHTEAVPIRRRLPRPVGAALATAAAALLAFAAGQAIVGGSGPSGDPTTLAGARGPLQPRSITPITGATTDLARQWRHPRPTQAAQHRHAEAMRRAHRSRRAAVPTDTVAGTPVSASYTGGAASPTVVSTSSTSYASSTLHTSTPEATTARSTHTGPTGAGAPLGPGTLGS